LPTRFFFLYTWLLLLDHIARHCFVFLGISAGLLPCWRMQLAMIRKAKSLDSECSKVWNFVWLEYREGLGDVNLSSYMATSTQVTRAIVGMKYYT